MSPSTPSPGTGSSPRLTSVQRDLLERYLASELEVPLLPDVAARVVSLCAEESSDARALELVLERDPSLASHLLRVANSAAYAAREPIVSLRQAVSWLGMGAIRGIVLAVSLQSRLFRVVGHEEQVRAIWKHCALAAAFAREIARQRRSNVEGAFLCGLLHDVGRPVVLQAALAALSGPGQPVPAGALAAAMNELHADQGARLAEAWKLADWTVAAVAHHHQHERAGEHAEEAAITRLADLLAHWAADPDASPEDFVAPEPLLDTLNLYPGEVAALLARRPEALAFAEALG